MADLKEKAIALLSSTGSVDMQTAATKTDLYTVPTGKTARITHVVIRDPSATLAGGTDYDFGTTATCTTWKQTVDLSSITSTSHYYVLEANNTAYAEEAAGSVFGIYPNTGSTGAATATIDVFGYLT
jgi:hypothetical protein